MCTPALPNASPASVDANISWWRASLSPASRTARTRYFPPRRMAAMLPMSLYGVEPWYGGRWLGWAGFGRLV